MKCAISMPAASKTPLISVIMGVYYTREDTSMLVNSVASILGQTVPDFEFLICDDGSTEKAAKVLDELAASDSRIRLLRHGDLFTLPQKLNFCLDNARGKYIARMDDDDWSYPYRFERQLSALESHRGIDFVGSSVEIWFNGVKTGEKTFPEFPAIRDFLFVQPFIHPALMFRSSVFSTHRYSEDKHCLLCEDYDLLLGLYSCSIAGMNISEFLYRYTVDPSRKKKMRYRMNECVTRFRRFRELGLLPRALPYVVKPVVVGMIPNKALNMIKQKTLR